MSLECSNLLIGFDQYQDYTAATEKTPVTQSAYPSTLTFLSPHYTTSDSDDHMKKLASDKPFQLADRGHRLSVWGRVKVN